MKFSVSSSSLLAKLQVAGNALASNPVIPILEDFYCSLKGNILTIAASNLEMTISSELEVNGKQDGAIAIPGKTLLETLRSMPEQPVHFNIHPETRQIEITSSSGKYKLVGEKSEDYPEIAKPTDEIKFSFAAEKLVNAIDRCAFATSNDEMRQAMKGVFLTAEGKQLTFVATDAHKLVKYSFSNHEVKSGFSIIITKKSLLALKGILPKDGDLQMYIGKTKAFFEFQNTLLSSRLIEAKFPDYNAVIPLSNPNKLTVNRHALISSLKRLALYANKSTHQVVFNIQPKSLTVTSQDLDLNNEATEQLACEYSGEVLNIGFNAKFLIEMLSVMPGEEVVMELSQPNRPGLVLPAEKIQDENLIMLIMPVMTNY